MKHKNLALVFILASFMLIANMYFVKADIYSSCNPTIQIVNQDPIPAVPNSYVKVVFEITGLLNCNGYAVKLNPEYPFSLDASSNEIQTISGGPYLAYYKDTWMVPYNIRVDANALQGDYQLKLDSHEGTDTSFDSSSESTYNLTVTDSQTDFDVVLQDVSGSQVSLGIVNTGMNTANSLVVKIPPQTNFVASGITDQILGNLAAGDYSVASFSITSAARTRNGTSFGNLTRSSNFSPDSPMPGQNINLTNAQSLKVQIDYTDGIGKRRSIIKNVAAGALLSAGNSSSFRGSSSTTGRPTTSKGISFWWYIGGVILVILVIIYMKRDKIKEKFHSHSSHKSSDNDPSWVSAERKSRKK